jgi:putative peptide zinc metalloprotease protein
MDPETRLVLHDLGLHREDSEILAGRKETGVFVALPELGAEIIAMLSAGMPVGAISDQLREEHGAEVDLDEFIGDLLAVGFVKTIDGHLAGADDAQQPGAGWNWLSPSAAAVVFSRPAVAVWLAAAIAAAAALVIRPSLLPRPGDLYWTSSSSVVIVTTAAFAVLTSLVHESAHLAAARSYGIAASLSLSTRLDDLVIQTRATALWNVSRRQRYRFYLAGMACDLVMLSAVILARAALSPVTPASRFLGAASVLLVLRLAWQAGLYTRTDLYLVVMDALRCRNLFDDAVAYTRFLMRRSRPGQDPVNPLDSIPERERRWIRAYAFVMVAGSVLVVGLGLLVGVPWFAHLLRSAGAEIAAGTTYGHWATAADGAVTLLVEALFLALFAVTFISERARRGRPAVQSDVCGMPQ